MKSIRYYEIVTYLKLITDLLQYFQFRTKSLENFLTKEGLLNLIVGKLMLICFHMINSYQEKHFILSLNTQKILSKLSKSAHKYMNFTKTQMPFPKITNLWMMKLTLRNFSPRIETSLNASAAKKISPKSFPKL